MELSITAQTMKYTAQFLQGFFFCFDQKSFRCVYKTDLQELLQRGESKGVGRKVQVYIPSFMRVHS